MGADMLCLAGIRSILDRDYAHNGAPYSAADAAHVLAVKERDKRILVPVLELREYRSR